MTSRRSSWWALALLAGCNFGARDEAQPASAEPRFQRLMMESKEEALMDDEAPGAPAEAPASAKPSAPAKMGRAEKKKSIALSALAVGGKGGGIASAEAEADAAPEPEPARTRAWFPETFLFAPRVVTSAAGKAELDLTVPDRLTSWRILGLAHSRSGLQAGAVTRFLGTLPVYVDPVLPDFLVAGDRARLPIQVVNTTEQPLARALSLAIAGGRFAGGERMQVNLQIPAGQSVVEYVPVIVDEPGALALRAEIAGSDALEKELEVRPNGRPMHEERGGTLAAERSFELVLPSELDPKSARLRLRAFGGALAVVRSELAMAKGRPGMEEDAYALMLAGRAPGLLEKLGETPNPDELRALRIVGTQRLFKWTRYPSFDASVAFALAAAAHPGDELLARQADRLLGAVAAMQRPDGTFSGGTGWTLQRLLVATADGLYALRAGEALPGGARRLAAAKVRAEGAIERNLARIDDPYTAAAILAAGAASGSVAEKLRKVVLDALVTTDDGARSVKVPDGVVRPDGAAPGALEAAALAVLALGPDAKERADLGAFVLGAYRPSGGFGDGRANRAGLDAALALFSAPLPERVKVTVTVDDRRVAEGTIDTQKDRGNLSLDVPAGDVRGRHRVRLVPEPAVPGLAYTFALDFFVPWKPSPPGTGLGLEVELANALAVGRPSPLRIRATGPTHRAIVVEVPLPAGIDAEAPSPGALAGLFDGGGAPTVEVAKGLVRVRIPAGRPQSLVEVKLDVIPMLAGQLRAGAPKAFVPGAPSTETYGAARVVEVR